MLSPITSRFAFTFAFMSENQGLSNSICDKIIYIEPFALLREWQRQQSMHFIQSTCKQLSRSLRTQARSIAYLVQVVILLTQSYMPPQTFYTWLFCWQSVKEIMIIWVFLKTSWCHFICLIFVVPMKEIRDALKSKITLCVEISLLFLWKDGSYRCETHDFRTKEEIALRLVVC